MNVHRLIVIPKIIMKRYIRREFYENFMMLFTNTKVTVLEETKDYLIGKLIYPDDSEDSEEVRWNCKKDNIPSSLCFQIISLINKNNLLEIDKIKLSRKQLYDLFCMQNNSSLKFRKFETAFEELLKIKFIRLESGEEFDSFFVHE